MSSIGIAHERLRKTSPPRNANTIADHKRKYIIIVETRGEREKEAAEVRQSAGSGNCVHEQRRSPLGESTQKIRIDENIYVYQ